ncbi:hypothetical protein AF72_01785 [Xylella taiwanensis]|uniref:Uncharacterized protein n=1 Tax=Xylella taiwanensis TaxID=1444770 RepID=Z9JMN3_9GAMM|nr:hypothetical protein AB672_04635 [Xylella taiwanensis]EWS79263.1 hypothetical protein AF72_01785 [Xylella taiwanensis]
MCAVQPDEHARNLSCNRVHVALTWPMWCIRSVEYRYLKCSSNVPAVQDVRGCLPLANIGSDVVVGRCVSHSSEQRYAKCCVRLWYWVRVASRCLLSLRDRYKPLVGYATVV